MSIALAMCLVAVVAGCSAPVQPAYVVTVFLETDTTKDHEYVIAVVQDGTIIRSVTQHPPVNFPFRSIVMTPTVRGANATVRITEHGEELASKTVQLQFCEGREIAVTIATSDSKSEITAACS